MSYTIPAGHPNQTLIVGTERITIHFAGQQATSQAKVTLSLLPSPRVNIEANIPILSSDSDARIEFIDSAASADCLVLKMAPQTDGTANVTLLPLCELVVGKRNGRLKRISFGIPNFPDFLATGQIVQTARGWHREDTIELVHPPWTLLIKKIRDIKEHLTVLKSEGGYSITAIGELSRQDDGEFW